MGQTAPIYIVCDTVRGLRAEPATCSKCAARIWPTSGTFDRALEQNLPMICIDCYEKLDDFVFGGFIDHGSMLPQELSEKLFVEFELKRQKNRV